MSTPSTEPSCRDDSDPSSLTVDSARERIFAAVSPVPESEQLALREALGRILAEPLLATINLPTAANSAMDGYALRRMDLAGRDSTTLRLIGDSSAGHPFAGSVGGGECVRIMTGALLPEGADTVVMQEQSERDGDQVRIQAQIQKEIRAGENVRAAGEDMSAGSTALAAGTRITAAELALVASLGAAELRVRRRVRVAYLSTGDELRSIGQPLDPGCIFDSNRYSLYALLTHPAIEAIDLGVVPDRPEALRRALSEAAAIADVVISSGGVSVGDADYVKPLLAELGEIRFWKIAIKPGRPLAFGRIGAAHLFGLPGNPVSAMVTFSQFVAPALRRMMGEPPRPPLRYRVTCQSRLRKRPGRIEMQRGLVEPDADGALVVRTTGAQGSAILSSMAKANCLILLPYDSCGVEPGDEVEVEPFASALAL